MAGHNKWSKVKRQKAVTDSRRSKVWAVITRDIMVAAREGGKDPDMNARLALAIQKAKGKNMPKENIERAIKRGVGEIEGQDYKECTYEGYSAQGVAIMVDALTDNTNRTVAEVRSVFSKSGGNLAKSGSVAYLFDRKGLIQIRSDAIDELELFELAADSGAEDVEEDGNIFVVVTPVEAFETVQAKISAAEVEIEESRLVRAPMTTVQKSPDQVRQTEALVAKLEDLQDVQEVFTNLEV
ncbi:MAG: YebC/PmpR family DNA-binding transcriptional regulator [Rhodothermaceae bacterium]|nr:YebC/PmpR family DNA-binding transcriptional regulator [Rhodothermaceae bacterium]MXZ16630.1 YebC/PmpR family DNA-binding transcriptional regulator [Rhodothermaceae bacterium]MXZ57143.1 YebC/PmpR family DNA-binding transcriptional regulator [Rhodothermaceae bacterium]MYB90841.1 YebC/PmpR family DNA-binding transcriptional regulator [Rhodothermaceae bacterium]MYD68827.1 YebC/PmpR family DNA-binding transcriptional regulator [Rhodothermaceae bacterium]